MASTVTIELNPFHLSRSAIGENHGCAKRATSLPSTESDHSNLQLGSVSTQVHAWFAEQVPISRELPHVLGRDPSFRTQQGRWEKMNEAFCAA